MTAQAVKRKDPTSTSKLNPRQQRMAGRGAMGEDWTQITDYDPERKYKWIFTPDKNQGPQYYESLGYKPEVRSAGGVRALFQSRSLKDGEEIVVREHLLMSISKEEEVEIQQYGAYGDSGLDLAQKIELKMTGGKNPRTTRHRGLKPSGAMPDYLSFARGEEQNDPN